MILVDEDIEFDWDESNSYKNWVKHSVTMKEAERVLLNNPLITQEDRKHSKDEKRYKCMGKTDEGRLLFIVFTRRNNKIRVISARSMNKIEREIYEKA